MRRLLALALAGSLLAGCSSTPEADPEPSSTPSSATSPRPTPRPKPPLTPKPVKPLPIKITSIGREPLPWPDQLGAGIPSSVSIDRAVLLQMVEQTKLMAGYQAKAQVKCPGGGPSEDAKTIRCTVRYRGLDVPWALTTSFEEPTTINPTRYVSYDAHPLKGILTAQNVYSTFWATHNAVGTEFQCSKLPDLFLVDLRKDTGYRCQYLHPGTGQTPPSWESVPVRLDAEGKLDFLR